MLFFCFSVLHPNTPLPLSLSLSLSHTHTHMYTVHNMSTRPVREVLEGEEAASAVGS